MDAMTPGRRKAVGPPVVRVFDMIKEPGSALTHFAGLVFSAFMTPVLLLHSAETGASRSALVSLWVFMVSCVLLYGASTAYHTFTLGTEAANRRLRKLDHCMIPVLIAGSYTPVCVIALPRLTGMRLLTSIWILALVAIVFKLFWVSCPKWVSSVLYLGLGWFCLSALPSLLASLSPGAFALLLAGGLIYSAGAVIYALKVPLFDIKHPHFGSHEIFHLFVMGGNLCHFLVMYFFLTG